MTTAPARQTFRQLVAEVAEKAKAKLPQAVNGRIESAVKLVLSHDVTVLDDGSIEVGSSSDPLKVYRLEGASCTCQDFVYGKDIEGWCQHRIAAGISKRVGELVPQFPPVAPAPTAPAVPLPEAPASVNVRVLVHGHEVQWTLRGHDEAEVFARLGALLSRREVKPLPKPAPRASGTWKRNQGRSLARPGASVASEAH